MVSLPLADAVDCYDPHGRAILGLRTKIDLPGRRIGE